jgi:hypothetical protein
MFCMSRIPDELVGEVSAALARNVDDIFGLEVVADQLGALTDDVGEVLLRIQAGEEGQRLDRVAGGAAAAADPAALQCPSSGTLVDGWLSIQADRDVVTEGVVDALTACCAWPFAAVRAAARRVRVGGFGRLFLVFDNEASCAGPP